MTSDAPGAQFEKLGLFYLGRRHDVATGRTHDEPVLYESRNLVTHAVCVGMTGSGKTGLCLGVLEEAAIDGVPVLAIDPKGDLGNLLLTFPGLTPGEFQPWVDQDEARRAGLSTADFAAQQASLWSKGLSAWGQDGARIRRLRSSAEFGILTPGSRAGSPVSILGSFAAPAAVELDDPEWLAERAAGTATAALALAGVETGPRSREHSLLAGLFVHAWQRGKSLDLASVIRGIQSPPFDKIGVIDLESFFPAKDRFDLAMRLNGVLASPGFEAWLEGESLDPQSLLYTADGRPRVTICSIAHLGDAERMFFVSLLLNQVVSWMRRQTGTASLRAVLYMDEILGFFPPVAAPPSKPPLLTLLKQGRAAGLGVLLATQNPVDLDYKALGNTGTWFLGRLQTERDKARVLEGLEGAAGGLDRAETDRILSALKKRIFLMHNVHDSTPTVFESRWTLSYLRGPLSREQIRTLKGDRPVEPRAAAPTPAAAATAPAQTPPPAAPISTAEESVERPVVPPGIQEFFLPAGGQATYFPWILGAARISFTDRKLDVHSTKDVFYLAPVADTAVPVDWAESLAIQITIDQLRCDPEGAAAFAPLPATATQPRKYLAWSQSLGRWLAQHEKVELLRDPMLGVTSRPDESERDFRIRLRLDARTARDAAIDAIRRKYAAKQEALDARLKRAEAAVDREEQQASDQKLQTAVSFGATVLDVLLRRKVVSTGSLGRATTAARGVGRSMKEASDVKRAAESVETVRRAIENLETQIAADVKVVTDRFEDEVHLEQVVVRPKRGQIEVRFVALAWVPPDATSSQ